MTTNNNTPALMPCRQCHFDVPIADYAANNGYCSYDCEQAAATKYITATRSDLI